MCHPLEPPVGGISNILSKDVGMQLKPFQLLVRQLTWFTATATHSNPLQPATRSVVGIFQFFFLNCD